MSLTGKVWSWPDRDPLQANKLAAELNLSAALTQLLINREITNCNQARAFLSPSRSSLHSPWLMLGMKQAVERLKQALRQKERIVIHGDYDADGIAATAILVETLSMLGGDVDYYLPSRFAEGYGLHIEALKSFHESGFSLALTVDCGINAVDEVAYASSIGLDMIITDHHLPLSVPCEAIAVVNPLQQDCLYPFKALSGAGIAFKLAQALMEDAGYPFPEELLDLAALGTAADVVPLIDENRVILSSGLEVLRSLQRIGFKALVETVSLDQARINSRALAFIVAPSVNAAGRMGEALPAAQLLLEKDIDKAGKLAVHLHQANLMRRTTEQKIYVEAENKASELLSRDDKKTLVLAGEGWHHGVIGIVASRLVEKFNRPAALIALEDGEGRGSARSIPGFDITAALADSAFLLEQFGGHEQAAGFTIKEFNIEKLADNMEAYSTGNLPGNIFQRSLKLEVELEDPEINLELATELEQLEPHGMANPAPLLGSKRWQIQSWRLVGSDKRHLKLNLIKGNRSLEAIFFSGASTEAKLEQGRLVDLAFKLKKGNFRGKDRLEVELRDLSYSDTFALDQVSVIDRRGSGERFAILQRILKAGDKRPLVFVSTRARLKKIENCIGKDQDLFFVTGAAAAVNNSLPADFRTIIFYDLPLYDETLKLLFEQKVGRHCLTCHLLYDNSDLRRNGLLLDHSLPTAEQLRKVVKALSEAEHLSVDSSSMAFILEKTLSFKPAASFYERSRMILTEIGALTNNRFDSACLGMTLSWTDQLEGSSTFKATQKLRNSCEELQKLLLSDDMENITSFFKKLTRS